MAIMSNCQVKAIRHLTKTAKLTTEEREGLITKMKAHLSGEEELTREWAEAAIAKLMRKGGKMGGIKIKTVNTVKVEIETDLNREVTVKCHGYWKEGDKLVKHECDTVITGTPMEVGAMQNRCDDCRPHHKSLNVKS